MSKLRRNRDPESRRYWAGVDQLAAEVKQWPDWMGGERRTATMSETPINIEQFNRGYAAGYRDGWAKHVAERDALSAQLTEVTRERYAIQATHDEFCAKFPSKSVMRREAARRDPADPSAPTPR